MLFIGQRKKPMLDSLCLIRQELGQNRSRLNRANRIVNERTNRSLIYLRTGCNGRKIFYFAHCIQSEDSERARPV